MASYGELPCHNTLAAHSQQVVGLCYDRRRRPCPSFIALLELPTHDSIAWPITSRQNEGVRLYLALLNELESFC